MRARFELGFLGGSFERRYRAQRPEADAMPWGAVDLTACDDRGLALAREQWTNLALQEYEAASRHAAILQLLVQAQAPFDASAVLAMFPGEELAHAELCARVADALGGAAAIEYETDEVFAALRAPSSEGSLLLSASCAVLWEFCVNESVSHGSLVECARTAADPLLRAVWTSIAKDEAEHQHFGWEYLAWALGEHDDGERSVLASVATRALDAIESVAQRVEAQPEEAFGALSVFGNRGRDAYLRRWRSLAAERVRPRLASMLRSDV